MMPPRLNHKKSRNGCQQCKTRKVKCDEGKPKCSACRAHQRRCQYNKSSSSASLANDSAAQAQVIPVDSYWSEGEQRRLCELRLLHHFVTAVAPTLPDTSGTNVWATSAIECAFANPFLLHAIFAISALHCAIEQGGRIAMTFSHGHTPTVAEIVARRKLLEPHSPEYGTMHQIYLDRAVQEQRREMSAVSQGESVVVHTDATYLASFLVLLVTIKMIAAERDAPYAPPMQWLLMGRATVSVDPVRLAGLGRAVWDAVNLGMEELDLMIDEAVLEKPQGRSVRVLLEFEDVPSNSEDGDGGPYLEVYRSAAAYAANVAHHYTTTQDAQSLHRHIMSYPSAMSKTFVNLLEQRDSRALVIFAILMSHAKPLEKDLWWFHGVVDREVYGIQSILPEKWKRGVQDSLEVLQSLS